MVKFWVFFPEFCYVFVCFFSHYDDVYVIHSIDFEKIKSHVKQVNNVSRWKAQQLHPNGR